MPKLNKYANNLGCCNELFQYLHQWSIPKLKIFNFAVHEKDSGRQKIYK